jgi:hypothetical protein
MHVVEALVFDQAADIVQQGYAEVFIHDGEAQTRGGAAGGLGSLGCVAVIGSVERRRVRPETTPGSRQSRHSWRRGAPLLTFV